jgi:DNA invertase Pin-like site-specific DNA recombinase
MTRFIAYYRVSTDKQGRSGLGLDAQRDAVLQRVNGDAELISEFTEVESAKKNDRPQLEDALAACRVHQATLCIAKLDRLSRNQAFLMGLIDSSVDVVFCDLPDIPPGAVGRFMLQQMAAVAELEAGLISERTKAALAVAKARGVKLGGYRGYTPSDEDRDKAIRVRKEQACKRASDLIPTIEDIKAGGVSSYCGIAKALNDRGIPTVRGGRWQAVQVQRVLQA